MNYFEQKKQNRLEGYKKQIEKNLKVYEENPGIKVFSEEFSGIPLGQPIHNQRDSNYREKLERRVAKGYKALEKADYYKDKIRAVQNGKAIYSDDPEAIKKIEQEIEALKAEKEQLKNYNIKMCKYKTGSEAFNAFKDSKDDKTFLKNRLERLLNRYGSDRIGVYLFEIESVNRKILRLKKRLEFLKYKEKMPPIDFSIGEISIKEMEGQIRVFFPGKPNQQVRNVIKRSPYALKYSRFSVAWVRKLTATTGSNWLNGLKTIWKA